MSNDRNNTICQQKCNRYFAQPERIVLTSHYLGDRLTNPMLITAFLQFQPEDHR